MPRLETRLRAIHGPHFSVHRTLLGLLGRHWRPRGKRPGRANGGRPAALHVTDDTARHLRYTSRAKREADVSLSHRCTMEHHDATGVSPRDLLDMTAAVTGLFCCGTLTRKNDS